MITYRVANWQQDKLAIRAIRHQVFVVEQNVPEALEWDTYDATAVHFVAEHYDTVIATARLKIDDAHTAQIGRMAVSLNWRRQGVGKRLMQTVLDYCTQIHTVNVYLHAQVPAIQFYEQFGFKVSGDIFMDAGIEHRAMLRNCAKKRS